MDPLFTFADGVGVGLIIWSLLQTLLDDPYVINYIQVASTGTIPRCEKIIFRFASLTQTQFVNIS